MRGLIRTVLLAGAAALVAFWLHTFGGAAGQLRALLGSPQPGSAMTTAPMEQSANTRASNAALATETPRPSTSNAAAATEQPLEPQADRVDDTAQVFEPSGPPSADDFAALLENGQLSDVPREHAEEFLRALRELEPPAN
jgi:hypothetical protein